MPGMPEQSTGIGLADDTSPVSRGSQDNATAVLGSLRITLWPREDLSLPGNGGEALHGLFSSLIARRNIEWNIRLHRLRGPKPFSLSPLEGCQRQTGRSLIAAGQEAFFRASFLDTDLLATAIAAFYEAKLKGEQLPLGRAMVVVKEVERNTSPSFPSFQNLLSDTGEESRISLQFLSPTAFKVKGSSLPFPLPELVFSSLLQRWESFSPVALPLNLVDCFPSIRVSRYELKTGLVPFSKFKAIGFTGKVVYELPTEVPQAIIRAFNCLADFAFYSGVGWKTTMGMGQTRRIDYARPLPDGTRGDPEERRGPAGSDQE